MRIAVLYSDGSMNVMSPRRGDQRALRDARLERDEANRNERRPERLAKVVRIGITAGSVREMLDEEINAEIGPREASAPCPTCGAAR